MEMIDKILFWVYSGAFFMACIVGWVFAALDKRKVKGDIDESEFYFGRKSMRVGRKVRKDVALEDWLRWISFSIMLYVIALFAASKENVRALWMGTGEIVDGLPGVMLSGLGVTTLLGAFVGLKKDTWVGINVDVVFRKYGVARKFKLMLLLVIASYAWMGVAAVLLNGTRSYAVFFGFRFLVLVSFICYLFLFVNFLWSLSNIMMGDQVVIKRVRSLHEEFWFDSVSKVECSGRENELISILLYDYQKACERINLKEKIKSVDFDTNIRRRKNKEEQKGRYESLKWSSVLLESFIYSFLYYFGSLGWLILCLLKADYLILLQIILFGIGFFALSVVVNLIGESVTVFSICLVYGRFGYRFCKVNGRSRYTRTVPFVMGKNKYYGYEHATKNILAFFMMHLKSKHYEVVDLVVEECQKRLEKNPEACILLIVMDYLYKQEKKYFNHIDLSEGDKRYYLEIAKAFAVDVNNEYKGSNLDLKKYEDYVRGRTEQKKLKADKMKKSKGVNVQIKVYR